MTWAAEVAQLTGDLEEPPEGIGTVGMVLNFAVTLTVSRFTAAPPERVRTMVEEIRLPRAPPSPPVEL